MDCPRSEMDCCRKAAAAPLWKVSWGSEWTVTPIMYFLLFVLETVFKVLIWTQRQIQLQWRMTSSFYLILSGTLTWSLKWRSRRAVSWFPSSSGINLVSSSQDDWFVPRCRNFMSDCITLPNLTQGPIDIFQHGAEWNISDASYFAAYCSLNWPSLIFREFDPLASRRGGWQPQEDCRRSWVIWGRRLANPSETSRCATVNCRTKAWLGVWVLKLWTMSLLFLLSLKLRRWTSPTCWCGKACWSPTLFHITRLQSQISLPCLPDCTF